jgi:hypothetical protein
MASYLLLRNNKESGPFNFQDLVDFGLKPYDLIWVEGKSAAWRYPSEVEELKPYAPSVEEQPFDRFFKKNTTATKQNEQPTAKPDTAELKPEPLHEAEISQDIPAIEEKYEKYIPKKSVFVTLPGQKPAASQKVVANAASPKREPAPAAEPVIKITENPAAQVKYSQPLDEIKEMYVKTLQHRKDRLARQGRVMIFAKKAAVVIGLVLLGVLTGFIIKRGDKSVLSQQRSRSAVTNLPASTPPTVIEQPVSEPVSPESSATLPMNEGIEGQQTAANPVLPRDVEKRLLELEKKQKVSEPSVKTTEKLAAPDRQPELYAEKPLPVEQNPVTGERTRTVRSNPPNSVHDENKAVMKPRSTANLNGLDNLVSVSTNNYQRVAFGGIRNLELTVINDSKFTLDKVVVELQYLKPSEEPLKTELIEFNSVSPNGSMTRKIRDTNRGIKITYKIVDIESARSETAMGY